MYYNNQTIIFNDGKFVKASDAKTDLYSQTIHYGVGVVEGLRAYQTAQGTQIFKAGEHFDRFHHSAKSLDIKLSYSVEELTHICYRLLEENNLSSAYIRPLLYVGANMDMITSDETHLMITAWKWENYRGKEPANVMISSYQRIHPKSCNVDAKITGHYVNSVLAVNEAKSKGFDDAILLDNNGFVAEGSSSNLFYEKNGELFTPPLGNIVPGITRQTVFEIAKEMGVKVIEKLFTPEKLYEADGAFFSGTASEIAQIKSVNKQKFLKKWENTLGYEVQMKYHQVVRLSEFQTYSII